MQVTKETLQTVYRNWCIIQTSQVYLRVSSENTKLNLNIIKKHSPCVTQRKDKKQSRQQ